MTWKMINQVHESYVKIIQIHNVKIPLHMKICVCKFHMKFM